MFVKILVATQIIRLYHKMINLYQNRTFSNSNTTDYSTGSLTALNLRHFLQLILTSYKPFLKTPVVGPQKQTISKEQVSAWW